VTAKAAEEKFKEAKEAYEMLSDPQKRAAYDQYGHAGVDPNMRGPARRGRLRRLCRGLWRHLRRHLRPAGARGGGRPPGVPRQRPQLRHGDHAGRSGRGKDAQIRIPSWDDCDTCHGSGAKPGTSPRPAPPATARHGADAPGLLQRAADLPALPRHGKIIPEPCTTCHGQGKIKKQKTLEVKIPAGIDDGMRIRSTGNGEPGTNGGPPGDLYIEIRLKKHDIFERDGDDLHCQVPVSFITAALGGEIEVPTLAGKAAIDIPEGTQPASSSACAARASRACAPATPATCTATSRWRRRSSSPSTSASCCANWKSR
jgi:molecular chaperone DnaJ